MTDLPRRVPRVRVVDVPSFRQGTSWKVGASHPGQKPVVLVFSEFEVLLVSSDAVDILIFSEFVDNLDEAAEGCYCLRVVVVFVR